MEGLIPLVYKAIVQYRNGAWLDDTHSAAAYMRLPGDSGRFAPSDVQIFRLPSARSPPRSVAERRAVSTHLINS
ncbi:uncharacterized protein LOC125224229 [Salvia hispanica]|uniref:uncharacterized protein LOC125224229 n=1 Tax=Salvia hispanica TaxID=49212 RepID=UPI00200909DF|nr:uncharacterized protein LOC125224229 [Salvia hispanica]